MNWLRQLFQHQHKQLRPLGIHSDDSLHSDKPLRFTIYKATGGLVVQTSSYDDKKDTSNCNLYIIHDNDNLSTELSKIITIETLKL
jgi:hypothetical protein